MYINQEENLKKNKKKLEDSELKRKFDEIVAYNFDGDLEEYQDWAENGGFLSAYDRYLYEVEEFYGGIEKCVEKMIRDKEIEQSYKNLVENNYNFLIREGFSQEQLDMIINNPKRNHPNMLDKVVETVFVLETLKVFDKYDSSTSKIKKITRSGGDFYSDGDIYGYLVEMDNDQTYTIVLSNRMDVRGEALIFGVTTDTNQLEKEKQVLRQFVGFCNDNTLYQQVNKRNDNTSTKTI